MRKKKSFKFSQLLKEETGVLKYIEAGLILGLHPANERQRYFVTVSLIGWV